MLQLYVRTRSWLAPKVGSLIRDRPTARLSLRREEGQTTAEYALVLGVIALGAFVGIGLIEVQMHALYAELGAQLAAIAAVIGA